MLQRPGVAIPSDDRARAIVARLSLCHVPELVEAPRSSAPRVEAPGFDAPNCGGPESGAVKSDAPEFGALNVTAPDLGALDLEAPDLSAAKLVGLKYGAPESESAAEAVAPVSPIDAGGEPYLNSSAPDSVATELGALELDAPGFGAPKSSAPESGAAELDWEGVIYARAPRTRAVRQTTRAEDSFTAQEQHLFEFLWQKGREVPGGILRIAGGGSTEGARSLAAEVGIAYSTFQALTRALRDKFAIEIVQPGGAYCKVYAVYASQEILVRQRAHGYDSFVKQSGGGRLLVNALGERCLPRADLTVAQLKEIIGAPKSDAH